MHNPMSPHQLANYRQSTSGMGDRITVICHRCNNKATRQLCKVKRVYKEGFIRNIYICANCQKEK